MFPPPPRSTRSDTLFPSASLFRSSSCSGSSVWRWCCSRAAASSACWAARRAMTEPLLELQGLHKAFGALQASDGVDLTVRPGEIHALIGPNGAGKTTLIAQIAGGLGPDAGRIVQLGADVTGRTG